MADDNRPLKYMRYAIGEIVLVVIGILIALQINNWNQDRKDRAIEIQLLKTDFYSLIGEKNILDNINQAIERAEEILKN